MTILIAKKINRGIINHTIETQDDDSLVILAKQMTLTDSQKNVLKKGLKFIPKPKRLPIQTLHTDIRNFMHRLKTIFELRMTNRPQKKYTEPRDPFTPKRKYTYNPERLPNNGTLNTFLHRVRTEMLNTNMYKQDKRDNQKR